MCNMPTCRSQDPTDCCGCEHKSENIRKSIDYEMGFSDGFKEGHMKALENIIPLLDTARNPPPIIMDKDCKIVEIQQPNPPVRFFKT